MGAKSSSEEEELMGQTVKVVLSSTSSCLSERAAWACAHAATSTAATSQRQTLALMLERIVSVACFRRSRGAVLKGRGRGGVPADRSVRGDDGCRRVFGALRVADGLLIFARSPRPRDARRMGPSKRDGPIQACPSEPGRRGQGGGVNNATIQTGQPSPHLCALARTPRVARALPCRQDGGRHEATVARVIEAHEGEDSCRLAR